MFYRRAACIRVYLRTIYKITLFSLSFLYVIATLLIGRYGFNSDETLPRNSPNTLLRHEIRKYKGMSDCCIWRLLGGLDRRVSYFGS